MHYTEKQIDQKISYSEVVNSSMDSSAQDDAVVLSLYAASQLHMIANNFIIWRSTRDNMRREKKVRCCQKLKE